MARPVPSTGTLLLLLLAVATTAFTPPCSPPRVASSPHDRHHAAAGRHASSPSALFMNKKKKRRPKKVKSAAFGGASSSPSSSLSSLSDGPILVRPKTSPDFRYAGSIRPGLQSPMRHVPRDGAIAFPDYAADGLPKHRPALFPWIIEVKAPDAIAKMRAAGRCAREVLDIGGRAVRPGVTTDEIDRIVHEAAVARGAYPSPLNYHNFPKSCCTSVNEVICHGIPDNRPLREGDVLNLDITCYLDGYHGDCSEMFVVGGEAAADPVARRLLQATYDCWVRSLDFVKPGRDYKNIGAIVEDHVVERGFTTVKSFCGHGIGSVFHTNPNILHYRNSEPAGKMAAGHTFTIEPMICEGQASYLMWQDDWTVTTRDGSRSAQFEHTLLITPDGAEALTGKIATSPVQFWERESQFHDGVWLGTSAAAREREAALNAALSGEAAPA